MRNQITHRKVFERYMSEHDERTLFKYMGRLRCPWARRDLAWMRLLRHTGIRVGTLVRLTVRDARVALHDGHLTISDDQAKGGHGYQVYLTQPARHAMQSLIALRRELGRALYPDSPLVVNRQGGFVSERLMQIRMRQWCRAAGLRMEATPHWWRHTFAKRIMSRSTARDPRAIAQLALGHKDSRSTEIYTLPDREDIEQSLREAS